MTLEKYQRLQAAQLTNLFLGHQALWEAKATDAFEYAQGYIAPNPVRQDDLLQPLQAALVISQELRQHLGHHKLQQKYWVVWFAELIVEECWGQLTGGEE
jgi:hypothetical protein